MPRQPQGDSSLAELLQLAQFANAVQQPQHVQQELDQRAKHDQLSAAIQLLGLHQQMKNEDAQRELQKQAIESTATTHASALKNELNITALHGLMTDPTATLDSKMKLAAGFSPEIQDMVKTDHAMKVAAQLPIVTDAITNAYKDPKISSNPAALNAALAMARGKSPDAYALVDHDKIKQAIKQTMPEAAPMSEGAKLGMGLRTYGAVLHPEILAPALGRSAFNTAKQFYDQGQVGDFWSALINKPKVKGQ